MNRDEVHKLIGGYASGSLTEEERRQLFEAALEDQELFDALQNEQAVKELLDDPFSREQIRRAAAESLTQPKRSWFGRPWIWAASASLASAAVIGIAVLQWEQRPAAVSQVADLRRPEVAAPAPVPEAAAPAPVPTKGPEHRRASAAAKKQGAPATPEPTPTTTDQTQSAQKDVVTVVPPSAQTPAQGQVQAGAGGHQQEAFAPAPAPPPQMTAPGSRQASPLKQAPAIRSERAKASGRTLAASEFAFNASRDYSFARRAQDGSYINVSSNTVFHPGEVIRVSVTPRVAGPVVLFEWDANRASWTRLFPPEGETVRVPAFETYTIPMDLVLRDGERLRLDAGPVQNELPIVVR